MSSFSSCVRSARSPGCATATAAGSATISVASQCKSQVWNLIPRLVHAPESASVPGSGLAWDYSGQVSRLRRSGAKLQVHTACRILGWDCLRRLTIHHGRHTFISHALAGGRTLAEVKAAAGHASLLT